MPVAQLDNYVTQSRARVKANKNTPVDEFTRLLEKAEQKLRRGWSTTLRANLDGIIVELVTTSKHQADFWKNNWWQADEGVLPHATIYSVQDIEGLEPSAYYCPQLNTSLFLNTEYYGQCKSWALGMAAAILEKRFNTLSIHGATALYKGRGVVIIAPTGTGKTTHSFKIFQNRDGKICGDDWAYVTFPPEQNTLKPLIARQPEKSLYMRSESQREHPWLRGVFDNSLCENVTSKKEECEYPSGDRMCSLTKKDCVFNEGKGWCYYSFANSRVLVKREDLLGSDKVVDEVPIDLVVLLRRDDHSPPEVNFDSDSAIGLLRRGESMILPGAGPREKWGTISSEPWYNPYLLELDNSRQERFFRAMFELWKVPCVILNTGVETIQQSHERIVAAMARSR